MVSPELADGVGRLLRDRCPPEVVRAAEDDKPAVELWETLEAVGLPLISVPEEHGGSGGTVRQMCEVLLLLGRAAAPVPAAETALAGWILAVAGVDVPAGPLTVAPVRDGDGVIVTGDAVGDGSTIAARLRSVPWARTAGHMAVLGSGDDGRCVVACVPIAALSVDAGRNLAGEQRDDVTLDHVPVDAALIGRMPAGLDGDAVLARGALFRASAMAGALHRVAEMTVTYAGDRHQFGKPLNAFQAVQTLVVQVAEQAELTCVAVLAAADRFDDDPLGYAALAKVTAGRAARLASRMAHQVHGAIGVTLEHDLGLFTRRLHAWAGEFGTERDWEIRLGRRLLAAGPAATQAFLTGPGATA